MDGLALLSEARSAGLKVRAEGDQLVVQGPKRAEAVALRLIKHKGDVLPLVTTPVVGPGWDTETTQLIRWFLSTEPPAAPFELSPGVTIAHPVKYWAYLRQDIAAGPGRGRSYYGAFEANLRKLYQLYGPRRHHAGARS